jgi:hypothetical protein
MLKEKNGVEAIDINDYLSALFSHIGFSDSLQENSFMNYVDLGRVAKDLEQIGHVLKTMGGVDQGIPGEEQQMMGGEDQMMAGEEEQYPSDETLGQEGPMDAEDAAMAAQSEFDQEAEAQQAEPGMGEEMPEEEEEIPSEEMGQDQLMANLEKLNDLVADLTTEIESAKEEAGLEDGEGLEGEEDLPFEDEAEEEEEDAGIAVGGDAVDKEEADQDDDGDVDSEDLETLKSDKKKKKPFPPKK